MHRIVVVGASTIDLKARASGPEAHTHCAPGRIFKCAGGAARNIAENLARLSVHTHLLSAVGTDVEGTEVISASALAGVDLSRLMHTDRARTATFLNVMDSDGHHKAGISDLGILEMISADYLDRNEDLIQKANAIVTDTTPSPETLKRLAELCSRHKKPFVIAPTPPFVTSKVKPLIKEATLITPNLHELSHLTGIEPKNDDAIAKAAASLIEQGVRLVLITLGPKGIYFRSKDDEMFLPARGREVVDTQGAGDAFIAGFLYGFVHTLPLLKALEIGQFTASLTLDTMYNVHPKLRLDYIHSSVV
jgi:pseudouridine kinase